MRQITEEIRELEMKCNPMLRRHGEAVLLRPVPVQLRRQPLSRQAQESQA